VSVRAYLPLLLPELAGVVAQGRLPQRHGYAVTAALRSWEAAADEEDLEFEAMCQALDAARELGGGRRVVASADVAETAGTSPDARLDSLLDVPLRDVVSFHVEEEEGAVGAGYDDLLWYDATELSQLARATG
jgi:hypothetical protein